MASNPWESGLGGVAEAGFVLQYAGGLVKYRRRCMGGLTRSGHRLPERLPTGFGEKFVTIACVPCDVSPATHSGLRASCRAGSVVSSRSERDDDRDRSG